MSAETHRDTLRLTLDLQLKQAFIELSLQPIMCSYIMLLPFATMHLCETGFWY